MGMDLQPATLHRHEAMHRNALAATKFLRIPAGLVIELGRQVEL